jgi:hypothetical protein
LIHLPGWFYSDASPTDFATTPPIIFGLTGRSALPMNLVKSRQWDAVFAIFHPTPLFPVGSVKFSGEAPARSGQ